MSPSNIFKGSTIFVCCMLALIPIAGAATSAQMYHAQCKKAQAALDAGNYVAAEDALFGAISFGKKVPENEAARAFGNF